MQENIMSCKNVIKTYKYGTDYKFLTRNPCSGEVTAIGKVVEKATGNMPKVSGEIALLRVYDIPNGQTPQPLIDLYNAGYRGAIVLGGDTLNRVKGQKGFLTIPMPQSFQGRVFQSPYLMGLWII